MIILYEYYFIKTLKKIKKSTSGMELIRKSENMTAISPIFYFFIFYVYLRGRYIKL